MIIFKLKSKNSIHITTSLNVQFYRKFAVQVKHEHDR